MRSSRRQYRHVLVLSNLLLVLLACACDTTIRTDEAEVGEALQKTEILAPSDTFRLDTVKSEIAWIGSKMTGRHNGTLRFLNGELHLLNDTITAGIMAVNMTSLKGNDKSIGDEGNRKLATHLKSADFFDVDTYPIAFFELVSVVPYDSTAKEAPAKGRANYSDLKIKNPTHTITGNLSIKDKVKSVTFPARITLDKNELKAHANFNIDRSKWGLSYRSDESLGDKTIYANVNISFAIVAKR